MKLFSRIFSMLLLAFAFSVLFCTPTFAEESLSITIDGTPVVETTPNVLGTGTVDVYVSSSSRDGYKLMISDSDNDNSLVSGFNSINPLAGSVTADNFTTNAWGIKVGDNYLPVPKLSDNVLELANTSAAANNEKHTITFGMKVDSTAVSGDYSSEVVFTAVANPLVVHKTTLQTGQQVNTIWKTLAKGEAVTLYEADELITSIQKFTGDFTNTLRDAAVDIATDDSEYPVYSWFDNGIIYYYTEADEVFLNSNSSSMFELLTSLSTIDLNFGSETDVDPDGDGYIASVQDPVYITSSVTDMSSMFDNTHALTNLDLSNLDTSSVTDMNLMFFQALSLTTLDVSKWDTSKVTDMSWMFLSASNLEFLDVSKWDVSNVTDMALMFSHASALTTLDVSKWDTSNVTNMSSMFYDNSSLTTLDVSKWDTSNVTNMHDLFRRASSLTALDVSKWDMSKVTDISEMFAETPALTTLDVSKWDTSNVTNMSNVFNRASSLTALDVSKWNTSKATQMQGMFCLASSLAALDVSKWDTSNVTRMEGIFSSASALSNIDISSWDTSKVTNMSQMFWGAYSLTTIYASNKFVTSAVTSDREMFSYAYSLVGGNGTTYDANHIDKEYARIDTPETPGYFTLKRAARKATLRTGQQVNAAWKTLAQGSAALSDNDDNSITSIQKYTGDFTDTIQASAMDIAKDDSDYSVWSWYDNGVIYYYTEADEIFFNEWSGSMFASLKKLTSIDFNFGLETDVDPDHDGIITTNSEPVYITSNVTNMNYMFGGDSALATLDLSKMDTSNVTDMSSMFSSDETLTNLDLSSWNTSKVTNMSDMFSNAKALISLDVSSWDTSKVTDMSHMFSRDEALTTVNVSRWDTSSVTDMDSMFNGDYDLTTIDVSGWNTGNVTNMSYMFNNDHQLAAIDVSGWNTSNVTAMDYMFMNTWALTTLDVSGWNTSNVTAMDYMFAWTDSLVTIYASNSFNTNAVTDNADNMFYNAISLVGGNGTAYDANHKNKEYARIDTATTPGYFTAKPAGN